MQMKDVYCHVDSFRGGLPNMCVLYSTLTSLSLLFCLFLYICNFVELEFSVQNGGRATEALLLAVTHQKASEFRLLVFYTLWLDQVRDVCLLRLKYGCFSYKKRMDSLQEPFIHFNKL